MKTVDVNEAKTTLARLIEAVEAGEEIIIARAGKPVVELRPLGKRRPIRFGVLKGRIPKRLLDEIEKPLSDQQIHQLFGGSLKP